MTKARLAPNSLACFRRGLGFVEMERWSEIDFKSTSNRPVRSFRSKELSRRWDVFQVKAIRMDIGLTFIQD